MNGLVIGKFMPLTKGHCALLDFAKTICNSDLVVVLCYTDSDPIGATRRFYWLRKYLEDDVVIAPIDTTEFPDSPVSDRDVSRVWATELKKRFPNVTHIIASEEYGAYLAEYMGIQFIPFDRQRQSVSISATQIRNDPYKHWDMIADVAKPYFVKKVCVYGPESTGKTTLAKYLATEFNTVWVPEWAREWLGDRHCVYGDFNMIAEGQRAAEEALLKQANRVLFSDTDAITSTIYSDYYFSKVPTKLVEYAAQEEYDLYLLLNVDTPWIKDPQRDCGDNREEMYKIFRERLDRRNAKYIEISGEWGARKRDAATAVCRLLGKGVK